MLDLLSGDVEWEAGKVEMSVFLRGPRNGSKTVARRGVGRETASGVVEESKNEEDLETLSVSEPLYESTDSHPVDVSTPRFQIRSGSREGRRMP